MSIVGSVGDFVNKPAEASRLAEKNAQTLTLLEEYKQKEKEYFLSNLEDDKITQFKYQSARVVNNSLYLTNNYITLDKGYDHGIKPGMGVMSDKGIVGVVKSCSDGFSTVSSFLHSKSTISSKIKRNNVLGTSLWDGKSPLSGNMIYVPRHIEVKSGDTVQTSGYNAVFPEGITVGYVEAHQLKGDENFHDIKLKLATDFLSLQYVYVIKNTRKDEQKKLESEEDKDE